MPALINLKGRRFGKLLVIGDRITIKGRPWWPCKCDCGKECLQSSQKLSVGDAKSCGCSMGHPIKEIVGQRRGNLFIQKMIRSEEGKIFYECLCGCKKTTIVSAGNLNRKNYTRSCGCIRPDAKRNPSPIEVKEDHAEIIIQSKKYGVVRVQIDPQDILKINKYRWSIGKGKYVVTSILGKHVFLHHILLPPKEGFITDHKDRNKWNNKSENLRYATYQKNSWNAFPKSRGFKGIYFNKKERKWRARITLNNGTRKLIGDFSIKEQALSAYDALAMELRGEFALTNSSNAHNLNIPESDDKRPDNLSDVQELPLLSCPKNDREKPSEDFSG
jgi:hypothetical protein